MDGECQLLTSRGPIPESRWDAKSRASRLESPVNGMNSQDRPDPIYHPIFSGSRDTMLAKCNDPCSDVVPCRLGLVRGRLMQKARLLASWTRVFWQTRKCKMSPCRVRMLHLVTDS